MIFTRDDRAGEGKLSSRLGLVTDAVEVGGGHGPLRAISSPISPRAAGSDYVIADEAQFLAPEQIDQLARVVDDLGLDVFAFGITTDFRSKLFPGSQRLVELADRVEVLQVEALCWCGARATHNARTVGGEMVVEGAQVVVGDVNQPADEIGYEVLCRRHHRRRMTAATAHAARSPRTSCRSTSLTDRLTAGHRTASSEPCDREREPRPSGSATVAARPCGGVLGRLQHMAAELHDPVGGLVGVLDLEVRHPVRAPVAGQGLAHAVDGGHGPAAEVQGHDSRSRRRPPAPPRSRTPSGRTWRRSRSPWSAARSRPACQGAADGRAEVRGGLPDAEDRARRVGADGQAARVARVQRPDADRAAAAAAPSRRSRPRRPRRSTASRRSADGGRAAAGRCPPPRLPSISARTYGPSCWGPGRNSQPNSAP